MCQVSACARFLEADPAVHVTIRGHVDADVELCPEHAALYEDTGYLAGLIVPDKPWREYVAEHHGGAGA